MRTGWKAEGDGSFKMASGSRRQPPPPSTPWEMLSDEWRLMVSLDHHWRGSLKEVIEAATRTSKRSKGKEEPWPSPEEFILRWATARRWTVHLDPERDVITIRPTPGQQPPKQKPTGTDTTQRGLFDEALP